MLGFLKKLGKGLLKVAPLAAMAIPGVGPLAGGLWGGALKGAGVAGKVLKGVGAAAPILGGLASGRAEGRQAEAQQGQRDDQIRAQLAQLGAQRAEFERDSPVARAQQAARGNFMQNYRSLGGRSMGQGFGQQAQEAGDKLGHLGVEQLGKDTFAVPELSQRPQANALDKILSVAGPVAAGAGALQGLTFGRGPQELPAQSTAGMLAQMPGQTGSQLPPPEEELDPNFNTPRFPRVRF